MSDFNGGDYPASSEADGTTSNDLGLVFPTGYMFKNIMRRPEFKKRVRKHLKRKKRK